MQTQGVQHHTKIELIFNDVPEDGSSGRSPVKQEITFAELESASDCLLIGFPTLIEWSPTFFKDDDGLPWVHFGALNLSMPCETPSEG